ncbi:hypothetical protein QM480_01380 [Flectobacillus sp. DC10W]|jgi:hypothetical protein|uniref:Uncharacterized protein n=1 Tax=Flectobacillus longus TaxID=2984207 RepID=A0ABT6YHR2_9BACT|nr:hypothetical protein [Flectobacillus longus]MDI9862959.1 hypothetical protein [Flectobacillus longus]
MKTFSSVRVIGYLSLLFLNFSCVVQKNDTLLSIAKESYCVPPKSTTDFRYGITTNSDSVLKANISLKPKFSESSILIMNALRINDEIHEIVNKTNKKSLESMVRLNTLKQQIDNRVWMANSEIDALSAELDCEGERIDQIANFVDNSNSSKTTKLTVASIVIGAASSIATVLISNESLNNGVAIGAGVLGASLGFATLNPKGKKVEINTNRNLLRNVWLNQNRHEISPFVWYMLTEPQFSNSGKTTLLQNTKERWLTYQFDENLTKANKSVNFSEGGIYIADDLHARSQMINQFQSVVRSIKQNLNLFIAELNNAFD